MKKIALHYQILFAIIFGIIWGLLLPNTIEYIGALGDLFLRALKMLIVPLVFASIVSGVTNISGGGNLGRLGLKTVVYYISTSLLAILTGLFFVNIIKPGIGIDLGFKKDISNLGIKTVSFKDTLLNIIPANIIKALADGEMLSIIFFALLFGYFITKLEPKGKVFLTDLFNHFFDVMMKLTMFIIKFTPIGVFGIIAKLTVQQFAQDKFFTVMGSLSVYMLTVLTALLFHLFLTLPLLLIIFGKVSPFKHFTAMREVILTAFSTSSSNATLPLTIETVEHKIGVSNKISSFTLPLGATINMDGTALYECVAAMFIAQAYNIQLGFTEQIIVVFTALLASIGAAGIPMAGLVMMSIVLSAVGLPLEGIGLILAVDRVLDMSRTVVNVFSDTCGAVIIASSEGEQLNIK